MDDFFVVQCQQLWYNFQMQDIDVAFDYIPDETNTSVIYSKYTTP